MSPRRGSLPLGVLLLVAAVMAGCTGDGEQAPSPGPTTAASDEAVDQGDRIAVVIGPPTRVPLGEAAELEAAAAGLDLSSEGLEDVGEVRVLRATSDAFVADLVDLVVTDGYDIVCVVGTGTAPLLDEVARAHRSTRFCGTDGTIVAPPANVTVVGFDALALTELVAAAVAGSPSPVALVVGSTFGPLEIVQPAFESALGPGPVVPVPDPTADTSASPSPGPSPGPSAAPAAASPSPVEPAGARVVGAVSEGVLVAQGVVEVLTPSAPSVAVLLAPGAEEAGRALAELDTSLVVVAGWATDPEGQLPPGVLVTVGVDWAMQLRAAVVAARAQDGAGVQLLGLADGVFGVTAGVAPDADAAVARAQRLIREVAAP